MIWVMTGGRGGEQGLGWRAVGRAAVPRRWPELAHTSAQRSSGTAGTTAVNCLPLPHASRYQLAGRKRPPCPTSAHPFAPHDHVALFDLDCLGDNVAPRWQQHHHALPPLIAETGLRHQEFEPRGYWADDRCRGGALRLVCQQRTASGAAAGQVWNRRGGLRLGYSMQATLRQPCLAPLHLAAGLATLGGQQGGGTGGGRLQGSQDRLGVVCTRAANGSA